MVDRRDNIEPNILKAYIFDVKIVLNEGIKFRIPESNQENSL